MQFDQSSEDSARSYPGQERDSENHRCRRPNFFYTHLEETSIATSSSSTP